MESRKAVLESCLVSESLDYDTAALRWLCTIRWQPFSVVTICSLQLRRIAHFRILQGVECAVQTELSSLVAEPWLTSGWSGETLGTSGELSDRRIS